MPAIHFNEQNFQQEVISSPIPVLVDFWAEWCGPCRMMGPVIDSMADEYTGKLKVGKVNVDESSNLAAEFGIMSIPTMILFKEGKAATQIVGAMAKETLAQKINAVV
jgi:thioredoxin 1